MEEGPWDSSKRKCCAVNVLRLSISRATTFIVLNRQTDVKWQSEVGTHIMVVPRAGCAGNNARVLLVK